MTPVAVFAHRRPEHLRATLAALGACRRLDECAVTIFCDGPRSVDEREATTLTRDLARTWAATHSATVIERDENHGLASSIVTAVTELCAVHGRAIVIEDDLLVSSGFLDFMLTALDRFAEAPEVLQISGYMFPVEHPPRPDAFFLPLVTTWGWATWQRAWSSARWGIPAVPGKLADAATRRRFNLDDSYDFASMLEARVAGRNQSWGVLWQWHLFSTCGLALHPRRSLVNNIGFDDTATHRGAQPFATGAQQLWSPEGALELPVEIAADSAAFTRIKTLLAAGKSRPKRRLRLPSSFKHGLPMLKKILSKLTGSEKARMEPTVPENLDPQTAIYWNPKMADMLEKWGVGNTWDEIQYLLAHGSGRVLDIACGTGKTIEILGRFPKLEVHGCDISDFLIGKAAERGISRDRLKVCDATQTGYDAGAFEHSYSIGSLEHFSEQGITAFITEAHRITRISSCHMVPVARSSRDEGWMKTWQSFHNNSVEWWLQKYRASFPTVHVLDSRWSDDISVGKWFVCSKD